MADGPQRGWNVDTLHALLLRLLEEQEKRFNNRFEASDRAITKAENAQNAYNIGHNDLLRKLDKQAEIFISRAEFNQRFEAIVDRLVLIENRLASGVGKQEQADRGSGYNMWLVSLLVSMAVAAVAIAVSMKVQHP